MTIIGHIRVIFCLFYQVKTSAIEVAQTVLPKFEIAINSPRDFMPEDKKAHVVVYAKYTHGKPLKGKVDVLVCGYKKSVAINGQEKIEFDIEKDLKYDQKEGYKNYRVFARVIEDLTGLFQEDYTCITINDTYVISAEPQSYVKFKQGNTGSLTVRKILYIDWLINFSFKKCVI